MPTASSTRLRRSRFDTSFHLCGRQRVGQFSVINSELVVLETLVKPLPRRERPPGSGVSSILVRLDRIPSCALELRILERARACVQTRAATPDAIRAATALDAAAAHTSPTTPAFAVCRDCRWPFFRNHHRPIRVAPIRKPSHAPSGEILSRVRAVRTPDRSTGLP